MRFVERKLWPCLALVLVACSLVTEFPEPKEELSTPDGGRDDGGSGMSCSDDDDCGSDELCCGRQCVATGKAGCSACGEVCDAAGVAPNCSDRTCECEPGSGKGCAEGQFCEGQGKNAKCVGCRTNADCAANGDGLTQCLNAKCVECVQKDPGNPLDDEGCSTPEKSVCNASNVCESCANDDQCGPNQACIRSRGCFGCAIGEPDLSKNGCTASAPICRAVGENSFQCGGCMTNEDCRGGFCSEVAGAAPAGTCHNACDPNPVPAQAPNGCETQVGRGTCKADAAGVFSCQACVPADCAAGTTCATAGPQAGRCVVGPAGPGDCRAPTPVFVGGKCVECDGTAPNADASCATSTVGRHCNPAENKCAPCTAIGATPLERNNACSARSGGATPICGPMGICIAAGGCTSSADCSGATPVCSGTGACIACTAVVAPGPDAACNTINRGSLCVTASTFTTAPVGSCRECNPGGVAGMNGCDSDEFCAAPTPAGALGCYPCIPGAPSGMNGCDDDEQCLLVLGTTGRYQCGRPLLGGNITLP